MFVVAAVGTFGRMAQRMGGTGQALESVRAALSAREADLAYADRMLAEAVAVAHTVAVQSIRRIDSIRDEIDGAAASWPFESPAAAHELTRFLLAGNRAIAAVVTDAEAAANAEAIVLQQLTEYYKQRYEG